MKKIIFSTLCISMMLAACSSEDLVPDNGEKQMLMLATSVDAPEIISRAGTAVQSTQLTAGNTIDVFTFTGSGENTVFQNKVRMVADGTGGLALEGGGGIYCDPSAFINVWAIGSMRAELAQYFKEDENNILNVSIAQNQFKETNYLNSDYCAGHLSNIKADGTVHTIPMRHLASKVTVKISDGDANDGYILASSDIEQVVVNDVKKWLRLELNTLKPEAGTDPVLSVLPAITKDGDPVDVIAGQETLNCSAIIAPQALTKGHKLLEITVAGRTEPFTYSLPSALTLESGKEYIITVRYKLPAIEASIEVQDWNETTKTGTIIY